MSAVNKLRNALSSIDNAKRKLKQAASNIEDDHDIRMALRELEDAESEINRVILDVKRLERDI